MQHTRMQACYFISGASLSLGAAGRATGAFAGGPWDGVWRPWLTHHPGARCSSCCGVPGHRFSGHLLGGGQAGSGFTAHLEGQIHVVLCWMPGPVKSRWLTCYLWCPPDSGLILSFWVGHDASASQSTNWPEELINQSQPSSFTQGSCILLEVSGNGLFCIFLGSLSVCRFTGGTFHGVCYGIFI